MNRRAFLRSVGAVAGSTAIARHRVFADVTRDVLPKRPLGRMGFKVSVVGFSGFAFRQGEQAVCTRALRESMDRGLNYFDVAPAYAKGQCEIKMGKALAGIPRDSYYLACKTKRRDRDGAREELERSLERLQTDHFDVYQLHHLVQPADVDRVLARGGAMETILKAREEGKIRAIGFSAHTRQAALKALEAFPFDTVMFPINHVEYYRRDFGKKVLAVAREKGAAVLSIKTMSAGRWPEGAERQRKWWYRSLEEQEEINLAYRWVLSQPGVVMGFPPAWLDLQAKAIQAGLAYRPSPDRDTLRLREMATEAAGTLFKREEDRVTLGGTEHECPYPDHPHMDYESMWG